MSATSGPNPTLARRRLSGRMRSLRQQNGRELSDLASFLSVSVAQASRLDTGARGFQRIDVLKLADWYGVDEVQRGGLLALAEESRKRAWWQQIDLPDSYRMLIGMEQAATYISEYCGSVVPGLLQTSEYAAAAVRGSSLDWTAAQIRQAVGTRMKRQEILLRERPPKLLVVIDEAVLARTTGGRQVMRDQLDYLLSASRELHIVLQVIGFEVGIHPGGQGHFITVEVDDEVPDVVLAEGLLGNFDPGSHAETIAYRQVWSHLRAIALGPDASRDRIMQWVERLEGCDRRE